MAEAALASRLQAVRERIRAAESRWGRAPCSVDLLAVSKTFPAEAVRICGDLGQRAFGENYLQEALAKIEATADCEFEWHFIGPIQSNKTRSIAEHFAWVHTIDRLKIARRLAQQRPTGLPPLNVCLEVNVGGEASKHGIGVEEAPDLAIAVATLPTLRLRGLMAIPEPCTDLEAQRRPFRILRELKESLSAFGLELDTLSMGMSADLEAAIAEGATIVRVGTAIFGQRD